MARARARIAEAGAMIELAKKEYFPDVTLGLTYTLVGEREDAAGRAMPPEGNGDDVVGLMAGVNLPVWRKKLAAGVEEASERELAAQEGLRGVATDIAKALGDLLQRIPLTAEQYALFDEVLAIQAEEALRSAEAAYSSGALGALDLLDAERVLLEVRIATARTLADLAIAVARLEGAVAAPLAPAVAGSRSTK
jgi:outer membrane protein TolC